MKIPFLHFHEAVSDWLQALFFQGECVAYQQLGVGSFSPSALYPPTGALYALIVIESDPAQIDKQRVVRFTESGVIPSGSFGMPIGDLGVYECKGKENMQAFRCIGISPGLNHIMHVQYFG
jgi:hypothetical protein